MSLREILKNTHERMEIKKMLDDFCDLTGLAAVISDASGNMLTELVNSTEFCAVMRQQGNLCAESDQIGGKLAIQTGKACIYKCHIGVVDFAVPIFVGGEHIGNVLTGQVRTKYPLTYDLSQITLEEINYDYDTLKGYYEAIPFMDKETLEKSTRILNIISKYLEDRVKLHRINSKNDVHMEQMNVFNDFKLQVEVIVACIRSIKYEVGKNLIKELTALHVTSDCSNLNEGLFKSIYYYEMKSLKLNLPDIDYFEKESRGGFYCDSQFFIKVYDYIFDQVFKTKCFKALGEMDYAIAYIQRYSFEKMTSKDVARYMNLSPDHFGRIFKKQFGQSVTDYITGYKIGLAKTYLIQTDASILEIAMNLGYQDSNYFSRVFKKSMGVSPKKFRMNSSDVLIDYVNKMTE